MKINFKIKLLVVFIVLSFIFIEIFNFFEPKKVARYCLNNECITVVMQYQNSVSGGNSQLRVYKRNILTRYFLAFGSYAEFPIETHFLISDGLIDNKFVISSQSLPKIHGELEDKIIFEEIPTYSEGDNSHISSFDLDYSDL